MKNNKIQLPKFLKNRYNVWKATSYFQNEKKIKKKLYTKYQQKALKFGRKINYLNFKKND